LSREKLATIMKTEGEGHGWRGLTSA